VPTGGIFQPSKGPCHHINQIDVSCGRLRSRVLKDVNEQVGNRHEWIVNCQSVEVELVNGLIEMSLIPQGYLYLVGVAALT
jgi:hypothetical protein